MFKTITKYLVKIAMIAAIIVPLAGIGYAVDAIFPHTELIIFFAIIREGLSYFDFIIDTNAIMNVVLWSLSIQVAYMAYLATKTVYQKFNH